MEEAILKGDKELGSVSETDKDKLKGEVYLELQEAYIKCENLLHIQNKI